MLRTSTVVRPVGVVPTISPSEILKCDAQESVRGCRESRYRIVCGVSTGKVWTLVSVAKMTSEGEV